MIRKSLLNNSRTYKPPRRKAFSSAPRHGGNFSCSTPSSLSVVAAASFRPPPSFGDGDCPAQPCRLVMPIAYPSPGSMLPGTGRSALAALKEGLRNQLTKSKGRDHLGDSGASSWGGPPLVSLAPG